MSPFAFKNGQWIVHSRGKRCKLRFGSWEARPRADQSSIQAPIAARAPLLQNRGGVVGGPPSGRSVFESSIDRGEGAAPTKSWRGCGRPAPGPIGLRIRHRSRRGRRSYKIVAGLWEARPRADRTPNQAPIAAGAPLPQLGAAQRYEPASKTRPHGVQGLCRDGIHAPAMRRARKRERHHRRVRNGSPRSGSPCGHRSVAARHA